MFDIPQANDMLNNVSQALGNNMDKLGNLDLNSLNFGEILTSDFIKSNTNFTSVENFLKGFNISDLSQLSSVPQTLLNSVISQNSKFGSWIDFIKTAVLQNMK